MSTIENNRRDLSSSTLVLILGILSLVFCWCYGIIGLVLGIITLVLANSERRMYLNNPSEYTESSFRNLNTGRICGIIGICLSAFIMILMILMSLGVVVRALRHSILF